MKYRTIYRPPRIRDNRLQKHEPLQSTVIHGRLWLARFTRNLTQIELAERAGVSRRTIINLEAGRTWPTTLVALRIAKVLEMSVEEIFKLEQPKIQRG